MEACYEYLGCGETHCIKYGHKDTEPCWKIEGTSCNHSTLKLVLETFPGIIKEDACNRSGCIYYKAAKQHLIT